MNSEHPIFRRPVIFDPRIGERRLFWNELSDAQKQAELDWHAAANRQILASLGDKLSQAGITQTVLQHKNEVKR